METMTLTPVADNMIELPSLATAVSDSVDHGADSSFCSASHPGPPRRQNARVRETVSCSLEVDNVLAEAYSTGENLIQTVTPMTIYDYTSQLVPLATLRHILLYMRNADVFRKFWVIHERLHMCFSRSERRKLLALLDAVENYPADTMPRYLGCMHLTTDSFASRHQFTFDCGKRVQISRLLRWICDSSIANHLADKVVFDSYPEETTRGFWLLWQDTHTCKIASKCGNDECVNPLHFSRQAYVRSNRQSRDGIAEAAAELVSMATDIAQFEHGSKELITARKADDRERYRGSFAFSPVAMMLRDTDDDDNDIDEVGGVNDCTDESATLCALSSGLSSNERLFLTSLAWTNVMGNASAIKTFAPAIDPCESIEID